MRVLFLGSKRVGLRCLETLHAIAPANLVGLVTPDDSRDVRTVKPELEAFCRRTAIPLSVAVSRRDIPDVLRDYRPDLCVVVGWYWLLSRESLEAVPRGFLGIHFSLLPKYRGSSPLVWAIINGERETGASLFSLTTDMDAGDIWAQRRVSVAPGEYVDSVLSRLEEAAVAMLLATYPSILSGEARATPQDHSSATYCAARTPDDGNIDWRWSAARIVNFVRAQSRPYPGAFTYVGNEKVVVWRASDADMTYYGSPGQIARRDRDRAWVVCGDQRAVVLEEIQCDGEVGPLPAVIGGPGTRFRSSPISE
jgi:methionyl-tRNA formyltransferase